ncbi:MAG: single-stranded DNA-binding protein [Cyclobacteriaceae bacterium]
MTSLRNRVQLIGKLGIDPDVKEVNKSKKARFSLATNEVYHQDGNRKEETQWHNVIAWGKTAELAEKYLRKGKEVAVDGKLTSRSYNDKDGNRKYITEIVANELVLLGSKVGNGQE